MGAATAGLTLVWKLKIVTIIHTIAVIPRARNTALVSKKLNNARQNTRVQNQAYAVCETDDIAVLPWYCSCHVRQRKGLWRTETHRLNYNDYFQGECPWKLNAIITYKYKKEY